MKIPANANTKQLRKIIDDLRDEATGWHQAAKKLEDRLAAVIADSIAQMDAPVDQMGDNNPWKLASLALVVGIVIGWIGNGVL